MRWCTQWDASSFPGLCASCSSKLRSSLFLQKHKQCFIGVRKAQLYCFRCSLNNLHWLQKVLHNELTFSLQQSSTKCEKRLGVLCPHNHSFKWFFMRRKVLFQEQFMIPEQFMSIHFWTGNWFKTQVITGRPHLYAAKISPTAFLRLACAQHAFTDYMCCLQLCFDCTHSIPKVSCRRGLHGTCCSIGTSFWQGICLHCRVCHTRHKSVSIYHSKNSLGLLYLQAPLDSWHKLPLSQDPERQVLLLLCRIHGHLSAEKESSMEKQDFPAFDPGSFFFLFLFGFVHLICGSSCPPSLTNWFLSLVTLL